MPATVSAAGLHSQTTHVTSFLLPALSRVGSRLQVRSAPCHRLTRACDNARLVKPEYNHISSGHRVFVSANAGAWPWCGLALDELADAKQV